MLSSYYFGRLDENGDVCSIESIEDTEVAYAEFLKDNGRTPMYMPQHLYCVQFITLFSYVIVVHRAGIHDEFDDLFVNEIDAYLCKKFLSEFYCFMPETTTNAI